MMSERRFFEVSPERAGAYHSISKALEAIDESCPNDGRPVTIHIEPGEYRERVEIHRPHVTIEGETADSVRIVGSLGAKMPTTYGSRTSRSKTMRAMGARSVKRLPCMLMATVWLSMPAALRDTKTRCFWVRCRRMRPNRAGL